VSAAIRTSLRGAELGAKLAANRMARRPWRLDAIPKPYTPRAVEAGAGQPASAKHANALDILERTRRGHGHLAQAIENARRKK
jgi:hypothetical protein